MSNGRNKLNSFSSLKFLAGGKNTKIEGSSLKNPALKRPIVNRDNTCGKQSFQKIRLFMPQYRHQQSATDTLTLSKKSKELGNEIIIHINIKKQRLKDESLLFFWLCLRFPKCFNSKDKRPLKIGINDDIENIYQNEHFLPINRYILHNVIKRYVGDSSYQQAVIELKKRFDLNGKTVEHLSDEHIEHAKKCLLRIS